MEEDTRNTNSLRDEEEPLLSPAEAQEAEQQAAANGHGAHPPFVATYRQKVAGAVRYMPPILGICLATACIVLGLYVLYILVHIPYIVQAIRRGTPELVNAALIDATDDAVLISANLHFPHWTRGSASIPFMNVTILHKGSTVGWIQARNLELRGGITSHANMRVQLPVNVSANVGAVQLSATYQNITIASAKIGPVSLGHKDSSLVPVELHISPISTAAHEQAIAQIAKTIGSGKEIELIVSGADPNKYTTVPLWLRHALYRLRLPVGTSTLSIPNTLPSMDGIVKDIVASRLYAYWSADDSFYPWIGVSGQTVFELPNPTGADISIEVQSLVPHLELLDQDMRSFATVDSPATPFQIKQLAPMTFALQCDFDRLGIRAISGKEHQFTDTMRHAITDRHLVLGINGTLDVTLLTSLGKLHIDEMPFHAFVDHRFEPQGAEQHDDKAKLSNPGTGTKLSVSRMHITHTTADKIASEIDLAIVNPFSYGAYITDLAMQIRYAGLHLATVGVRELSLGQGTNNVTLYVDFHNHPADPRQQMFFLEATSGKKLSIEIAGFPNCTSIAPLEASLYRFSQKIKLDLSKFGDGGRSVSDSFPRVLREVIFHLFAVSAEATVVNPVSGADIWLQNIEATGYYKEDTHLGTLQYDFTKDALPQGVLLPFNQEVTTPWMPIAANQTSIGWGLVRKALGGSLDVDVFTNMQLLVGEAQFNITVVGKGANVKIRW
ncbi:hypothetical protein GGI12_004672 [Dipsacomyces acuminosporus]|nr:hypothetical protein GGI12_004672 [Dipsacomyces acuminosporus]